MESDLRISYNVGGGGPKQKVVPIRDFAPEWAEAAALCLIPDASCIALILANGNVLLVPIKTLIDVPWGCEGIVADDSLVLIEVETNEGDCFRTPTSALCYNALYSKRPFLIYSNKAGQIFIIDLTSRKLSVGLGAPQSVHAIETFSAPNSVHLLVTGFTGAQWIVPLESEGRSLRETLADVIPSELEQLHKTAARLSTTQNGKLCLLDIDNRKVQLFDDIAMKQPCCEANVPENTWLVHLTENTVFAISQQTTMRTAVHFGMVSLFADVTYDELEAPLPEERILAIIPVASSQPMPFCVVICEKGLLRIQPARSLDEIMVEFVSRRNFAVDICDYLATRFNQDRSKLCTKIIRHSLEKMRDNRTEETSEIEALTKLALDAQLDMGAAIRVFAEFEAGDALLPVVLARCSANKRDESRHSVVELYMSKLKRFPAEKENIERDLRAFLLQYTDVDEGIKPLLVNGLWSCVATIVSRSSHNSETVAKYLAASKDDWPTDRTSHIVRTVAGICWSALPADSEELLTRMAYFLPHLRSISHIATFARIGEEQMNRFHQAGATLYALCSLRLLSAAPSFNYASLPSNTPLSCGSNCTAVVSEEESVMFVGEFSAGSMKMKDAERNKAASTSRLAMPRLVSVPERVCSVSCGTEHLLCLTTYGKVYSFGRNRFGECGVGHKGEVNEASRVRGPFEGVRTVRAGHYHSALIDSKGRVFTWGWALHGQLGHDTRDRFEDVTLPRLVETIQDPVIALSCGYAHTVFLSEAGKVYACGNGGYGQLGCGEEIKKRYRPLLVDIPEKVKLISSKYFHCLAVTESQKIFQWGTSPQALKMKIFLAKRVRAANKEQAPTASPSTSTIADDKPLELLETSQTHLGVQQVEHMITDEIAQIDAGYSHSAVLTTSGLVYTWGKGLEMQLGHGNKKEQEEPHQLFEPSATIWRHVSCGFDFTSAVAADGSVFVWGRNDKCQLGVQSTPSPQVTRKLIIKGPKGPRSIQIAADSPCIAVPTRLPSITAFVPSDSSSDEINDGNLIRFLQRLDPATISEVSSHLQRNAILSAAAVFVHLLAGELQSAVELLVHLPVPDQDIATLLSEQPAAQSSQSDVDSGSAVTPTSLLAVIWDLVLKHPNFGVQWTAVSTLISNYPIGDLLLRDRKLSAQAPMILAGKPDMLAGLSATEKLRLLEKWQPEAPLYPMQIAQNDLQNLGSRVRYWSCCGSVEKCGAARGNVAAEKRRVCAKCCDAWKCAIKSKFSKYS
ncbi:X-linked retinitis pigmentosa GTPase regulator -like protein [Toxocara canis]|uniref:X-linked retinitis pigmentosa GTPase regulator-like protein n=1 Tax=Toxocara canis TaxID=6265 RepID=A0A0B2USW6_TOXCA|nr:X-linked retinitis pigmentosa GTPase regulator -like protein [Toxocara canis]